MQRKKLLITALTAFFVMAASLLYAGKHTAGAKPAFPCHEREVVQSVVDQHEPSEEGLDVPMLPSMLYL